jgi:hypothetical protein
VQDAPVPLILRLHVAEVSSQVHGFPRSAGGAAPRQPRSLLPVSRILAPCEKPGNRATGAEGAHRPSGSNEGQAACRGRYRGGPASTANKKQCRPERVPDWTLGDARAVRRVFGLAKEVPP